MPETWTVKKILDWTHNYFAEKDIPEPRLSAELLLAGVLKCRRLELYLQFERILTPEERSLYREYVSRRARREPVQYILGETEFYGLPFRVSPAVLIPRPDTELLVDAAIEYLQSRALAAPKILDIGTGSGCIAVALARRFPAAEIWGVDISAAAIELAAANAARNAVEIRLLTGDYFEMTAQLPPAFDVIVSNPPYIAEKEWAAIQPEVRQFEPREALLAGADGLDFYRRLVAALPAPSAGNGAVFLEVGYAQAEAVAKMLEQRGFLTEVRKDLQRIDRVVTARAPH